MSVALITKAQDSLSIHQFILPDSQQTGFLAPTLLHTLDNLADGVFVHNDGHSQFAEMEDPFISIRNASFRWTRWYIDDHRISQVLTPGSPLFRINMYNTDLAIDTDRLAIGVQRKPGPRHLSVKYDEGSMGNWLAGADEIVNFIYGHESARQTARQTFNERRRLRHQLEIDAALSAKKENQGWTHSINLLTGNRDLTGFDFEGLDGVYPEAYTSISSYGHSPEKSWNYAAGYKHRDQYLSEYGHGRGETATLDEGHLALWKSFKSGIHGSTGFNLHQRWLTPNQANFSRNVIDQDGEGFEPWVPDHRATSLSHHLNLMKASPSGKIQVSWESYNSVIRIKPLTQTSVHPVFQQTNASNYTPLYVRASVFEGFTSGLLENQLSGIYQTEISNQWIFHGELGLALDGMIIGKERSKISLQPTIQLALRGQFKKSSLRFAFTRQRVPYTFDIIQFLSPDYQRTQFFFWTDQNANQAFETEERGEAFLGSGGFVHNLGSGLKQPVIYSMTLPYRLDLSPSWQVGLTGDFQSFRNTWTVEFEQPLDELGYFQPGSGQDIFVFNPGARPTYKVVPLRTDRLEAATGNSSFLVRHPFGAGLTLHTQHRSEKWWMHFAFRAYMALGFGPLGNGAQVNQLQTLSENLANPNTYLKYYGRLDTDRSFVSQFALSYQPNPKWTGVLQIKYKDGQPFNFFETYIHPMGNGQHQLAIWNEGIKGDNPFTGEFNSRNHGLWNVQLRLAHRLELSRGQLEFLLAGYNLLDLGMGIREYTFAPALRWERHVLDLEVPRAVSLAVNYTW